MTHAEERAQQAIADDRTRLDRRSLPPCSCGGNIVHHATCARRIELAARLDAILDSRLPLVDSAPEGSSRADTPIDEGSS